MLSSVDNFYLAKHANYGSLIEAPVPQDLAMLIVIPSYNEPKLEDTLKSLSKCAMPDTSIELLVVVNECEKDTTDVKQQNKSTLKLLADWTEINSNFKVYSIFIDDVPIKKAGVGYARKTGMDEAVLRLEQSKSEEKLIVCLDADTIVEPNYLDEILNYFQKNPKCPAASIEYEHPLDNVEDAVNGAIIQYELHLRYYEVAQRWAGLPYAQQTVGSAMAARSKAYQGQGGMNTRKAGEDFYFMHKFTSFDNFGNITLTHVIPSARISDRVPFGTGRAMQSILDGKEALTSYAPQSFAAIKKLTDQLYDIYEDRTGVKNSEPMAIFLRDYNFPNRLVEIRENTTDFDSFEKRFYRWFDAFKCMKFLHYSRDNHHPNIPVGDAANWLNKLFLHNKIDLTELELLTKFRANSKTKR